jgi:hypothetical protein
MLSTSGRKHVDVCDVEANATKRKTGDIRSCAYGFCQLNCTWSDSRAGHCESKQRATQKNGMAMSILDRARHVEMVNVKRSYQVKDASIGRAANQPPHLHINIVLKINDIR